jgi:hypothetical protein
MTKVPGADDLESGQQLQQQEAKAHWQQGRLPSLKTIAALLLMLLEGYAYVPLVLAVFVLNERLASIAPIVFSTSAIAGWSWTGLAFFAAVLPIGLLLLPETYFLLVVLLKHLVLGAPRVGPDGLPLMDSTWDKLRHFCMVWCIASVGDNVVTI